MSEKDKDKQPKKTPETKQLVEEFPTELGILPLRDVVVFPAMVVPLIVSRPKTIKLIDDCLSGEKLFALVAQKNPEIEDPTVNDLYSTGTAGKIIKMLRFPDNTIRIMAQGLQRVNLHEVIRNEPYLTARVSVVEELSSSARIFRSPLNSFALEAVVVCPMMKASS